MAAMAVAYRPDLDTSGGLILAVIPWLILVAMVIILGNPPVVVRFTALAVAVGGWTVLIFEDPRWSVLSFALYMLAFTADTRRPSVSIAIAGLVTAVWTWAFAVSDTPPWTTILPVFAFAVGTAISLVVSRTARMAEEQAALVKTLRATRAELADSERRRGTLEERARMAGEIHDKLAQGFTSLVLLARAGRRSTDLDGALAAIEATAEEHLEQARRIVAATDLDEFEGTSLREAIDRHVATAVPEGVTTEFRVVGTPRRLTGDIEVTLLRATQEALRNVVAHAGASNVEVTLSYLGDSVALDVRDDGVGFVAGQVTDRGTLTGGQGLETLSRRARALSGELTVESGENRGSVVSLLLPIGAP